MSLSHPDISHLIVDICPTPTNRDLSQGQMVMETSTLFSELFPQSCDRGMRWFRYKLMDAFSFPGGLGRTCAKGSNVDECQALGLTMKGSFYSLKTRPYHSTTEHPLTLWILY